MCQNCLGPLTFESMLSDPLIRMVMDSDGVTVETFVASMERARRVDLANNPRDIMYLPRMA